VDLSHLSIIDDHSHPFLPERESPDPLSYWTTSLLPETVRHTPNLLVFRRMMELLRPMVGAGPGEDTAATWSKRAALYSADRRAYVARLFSDARISSVFVDIGYPTKIISGYDVDPSALADLLPSSVKVIVRMEPIIMELIGQGLEYPAFLDAFDAAVEKKISAYDVVALKTAIAYFGGLGIRKHDKAAVARSYEAYRVDPRNLGPAQPLLHTMVFRLFDIAARHGLPVQVHTGFGNAPLLDLAVANPSLLFELLSDETCRKVPIVLLHAGYPFVRETGYIANNYPNVFVDISQVTQYVGTGLPSVLVELLSMVPIDKLLYGSDGLGCPELFWWPARHAKESLGTALDRLLTDGQITARDAEEIAMRILHQNATELYSI
jgi:predicted TIM-barrel fold metal-dependent hydrolase